ncbi:MAG: hypothetical protein Q4E77_01335 [Conchiformibius sp.]|nr:hypothetical protein [Conchiformibius sp.]
MYPCIKSWQNAQCSGFSGSLKPPPPPKLDTYLFLRYNTPP